MRWTRWTPLASLALALAVALPLVAAAPENARKSKQIERGEYLVTVMGCNDCHTPGLLYNSPDFSRRLSGSELGWRGPWGVSYARNLTPDLETGIGKWSEQQIVNTIRTGTRPDGSTLLPPMPWPNYSRLTDEDAFAVAAYLKSLPAVKHANVAALTPDKLEGFTGAALAFPPPPAWDVPGAAGGGAGGAHSH